MEVFFDILMTIAILLFCSCIYANTYTYKEKLSFRVRIICRISCIAYLLCYMHIIWAY